MHVIRRATPDDSPALARLFGELGYNVSAEEIVARLERYEIKSGGRVLVADEEGDVLAFAAVEMRYPIHYANPVCYVSALAVLSHARRRGIGGRLLTGIEDLARELGCLKIVVTSAERRADAHAFYETHGWRYTGRRFGKDLGIPS
jgi:GNAT superfamily N-acetyltransferase